MSISKVVEAYLVLKSFSVYFATSLVKAWLNTKTETPALDPRRNAGKRDKPLTLGGDWGRRVMQCAFSICSRGQFEVVYSLEVVCILYNSCVYCTNLLAKLPEIFWCNWMHMEILVKTILHRKDENISEHTSIGYCCIFDGWLECLNLNSCQHLQFSLVRGTTIMFFSMQKTTSHETIFECWLRSFGSSPLRSESKNLSDITAKVVML